jgi:virginiamycin A acetyltransferase
LHAVVQSPSIEVGDYTFYHNFENPLDFERKCVLYHYPLANHDRLKIGKFCSIAHGAKFLFNGANHTLSSLSTYPFPVMGEEWDLQVPTAQAWDNKGDIVVGNDVWIGFEAVIMAGVTIGDGAIIGSRAVVTKDVPPYSIVGGTPAKLIRKRFSDEQIDHLLKLKWWDWNEEKIKQHLDKIMDANIFEMEQSNTDK